MANENNKTGKNELSDQIDSPKDKKAMEERVTNINMPSVKDIPGQEHIKPVPPGEMADTTASSADEEGADVYNNNIDHEIKEQDASNVSDQEKENLFEAANDMPGDDENLRDAALDSTDDDGTPLNEDSFDENISPSDLDVPGASLDDEEERIGEEDEENNEYSIGGTGSNDQDGSPRDQF